MLEAETRDGVPLRDAGDVDALDDGLAELGDFVGELRYELLKTGDVENWLEAAAGHVPVAHIDELRSTIMSAKQAVPSATDCTAVATPA